MNILSLSKNQVGVSLDKKYSYKNIVFLWSTYTVKASTLYLFLVVEDSFS